MQQAARKLSELHFQKRISLVYAVTDVEQSAMDAAGRVLRTTVALYSYCRVCDVDMNHIFKSNPVLICGK